LHLILHLSVLTFTSKLLVGLSSPITFYFLQYELSLFFQTLLEPIPFCLEWLKSHQVLTKEPKFLLFNKLWFFIILRSFLPFQDHEFLQVIFVDIQDLQSLVLS